MTKRRKMTDEPARLASWQRYFALWFSVQIVVALGGAFILSLAPRGAFADAAMVRVAVFLWSLATIVPSAAAAVCAYRVASALRSPMAIVWALFMFVMPLNVVAFLILCARGTRACREAGIPVGLWGPEREAAPETSR
ncbi:MAG: hypothetical protein ABFD84_02635 [Candidatus Polarisedimenticolia bacterium]|nr:hypothetical protein [bacterium]